VKTCSVLISIALAIGCAAPAFADGGLTKVRSASFDASLRIVDSCRIDGGASNGQAPQVACWLAAPVAVSWNAAPLHAAEPDAAGVWVVSF
jgi:hypothetical protein